MKRLLALIMTLLMVLSLVSALGEADSNNIIWTKKSFVDEFDDPTGEYYLVSNLLEGTFSNSATKDSKLSACIFFLPSNNSITIRLLEYGDKRVNNPFSKNKIYDLVFKDADGEKYTTTGIMYSKSEDVYFSGGAVAGKLIYSLMKGGTVKFSLSEQDNSLVKYIFSIPNADGFEEGYYSLLEIDPVILKEGAVLYHKDHGLGIVKKTYKTTKDNKRVGTVADVEYDDGTAEQVFYPEWIDYGMVKLIMP